MCVDTHTEYTMSEPKMSSNSCVLLCSCKGVTSTPQRSEAQTISCPSSVWDISMSTNLNTIGPAHRARWFLRSSAADPARFHRSLTTLFCDNIEPYIDHIGLDRYPALTRIIVVSSPARRMDLSLQFVVRSIATGSRHQSTLLGQSRPNLLLGRDPIAL